MAAAAVVGIPVATAGGATAATPTPTTVHAPKQWDPRIVGDVRFVEKERGLTFDHPIPVAFLSDEKFVKELQGDSGDGQGDKVTKRQRESADREAGQLRALGLIEGDVDLIGANKDLDAASVTGFYDDRRKRMVIRGESLDDVGTRITVVHELTHALQDQRFDLHALDRKVRTSGEDFALTALIEGDATHVEQAYYDSLTQEEQDAYDNADVGGGAGAPDQAALANVPHILDLFQEAPYVFGVRYVALLDNDGGTKAIDAAFRSPPRSEEQIIDPVSYGSHDAPRPVKLPALGKGERQDDTADDFGAFSLYMLLASRLSPATALQAAEGWGGDRSMSFRKGGKECVRTAFAADSAEDATELGDALDAWAAAMPSGAATATHDHGRTTLTACESTAAAPTTDALDAAFETLIVRNEVALGVDDPDHRVEGRCIADHTAVDPELSPLLDRPRLTDDEKKLVQTKIRSFAAGCVH